MSYIVDGVHYTSEESYLQIQEAKRVEGIKAQALFDENPMAYPPCSADPPHAPNDSCGYETCNLHNILWIRAEGATIEQAIGLTAVYSFSDGWGYGTVADALGGMDEFNKLNEDGPQFPDLIKWYTDHQPLIHYLMETREEHGLASYWWCAKHNDYTTYQPKQYDTLGLLIHKIEDGSWQVCDVPGFGFRHPGYERWDEYLAAAGYTGSKDWWETHQFAHFEYEVNPKP